MAFVTPRTVAAATRTTRDAYFDERDRFIRNSLR
jgi:hypothetical protein